MGENSVMLVATCIITLELYGVESLKDKRRILKSVLAHLRQQYNLSVAEVGHHDVWQTAVIGLAAVGTDSGYLHGLLEKSVDWIEQHRPDVPIHTYSIEIR
jgi:uncharacterized protein YlxP (DUF503 family)